MPQRSTPTQPSDPAPALSVVMPVHNALPHLDAAVESILNQTYRDFEFVILDDGSTDGSGERLKHWAALDKRIRLLSRKQQQGPVRSSNLVATEAKAPLVARMDADDISYPERLQREVEVFAQRPDAGVVASLCDTIDGSGTLIRPPEAWRIFRRSPFVPFAHGAMMYRRALFERVGGYREQCIYWEDQDLIVRMAAQAKVMVIPRALYQVRLWTQSTRVASDPEKLEGAVDRMYGATDRLLDNQPYEDLLGNAGSHEKVDPRVFIALGCVKLWGGGKPRLFRRLLKRGSLGLDRRTLTALLWSAWASTSPGTLRAFMTGLNRLRNGKAPARAIADTAVEWVPFAGPSPIGGG